jgi:hypothetical protein
VRPLIAGGTPLRDIEVPRSIEGFRWAVVVSPSGGELHI